MANKIFQDVSTEYGGGMKFNKGFILTLSGGSGELTGLIVQNLDIGVQRPITTLYDLTSQFVYYVSGRCTTQLTLQKACGPRGIMSKFYEALGDVCNADKNNMTFKLPSDCETASDGFNVLTSKNCILTQVSFSCNVQNYVVSDNCQIQGTELEMDSAR